MTQIPNKILTVVLLDEKTAIYASLLKNLIELGTPLILHSDGMSENELNFFKENFRLNKLQCILHHGCKLGKSESLFTAVLFAKKKGFDFLLSVVIDQDFNVENLNIFIKHLENAPKDQIYVFEKDSQDSISAHKVPSFANHLMKAISGSEYGDLLSTIRAYPVQNSGEIIRSIKSGDFDFEVLLRANSKNIKIMPVLYHENGLKMPHHEPKSIFRLIKFFFFLFLFKMTRPIKQFLKRTT